MNPTQDTPCDSSLVGKEESGYILLPLLIIGAVVFCMALSTILGMQKSFKSAGVQRIHGNVFNIAEAGREHALAKLRGDSVSLVPKNNVSVFTAQSFDIGNYTVSCSSNATIDTLWISSKGNTSTQSVTIASTCLRHTLVGNMNFNPLAAVTAKSNVQTLGNITIDGNDWDSTNSTIVGTGVYAISTCGTYSKGGSSEVYGRGHLSPLSVPVDSVVKTHNDTAGYPHTPEQVLGLAPGALNKYKTTTVPPIPFHGIVYVDYPGTYNAIDFSGSSGIFIFHNSTFTSILKNIHGSFKGILICDQIDHVNGDCKILGAVVTLSNDPSGNAFGNGNATIRFSSQILKNLGNYTGKLPVFVDILTWKEL